MQPLIQGITPPGISMLCTQSKVNLMPSTFLTFLQDITVIISASANDLRLLQ